MVPARRMTQCRSEAGLEITGRDRCASGTPHNTWQEGLHQEGLHQEGLHELFDLFD